jgi:acetyl esterase/lipase
VGKFLASQGICTILPNYRLSPNVKHPEHIKDLAQAFSWTKKHIAEFGGNPDQIFLVGHSAGGHLVALLATDESWLGESGCRVNDIRGVVALSGVYHIPPTAETYSLGGSAPNAFHWNQLLPIRSPSSKTSALPLPGLTLKLDVYGPMFGDDHEVRASASPLSHVRPGLPPFLILSAEHELPTLAEMAQEFHRALCDHDGQSELYLVQQRNHNSIMFEALGMQDPVGAAIVRFVRSHSRENAP